MKRLLLLITICISSVSFGQYTSIPDPNFEQALIDLGHDDVIDGQVLTSNVSVVSSLFIPNLNISNLSGIQDFTSLVELRCHFNSINNFDFSQNDNIQFLEISGNPVNSIDVSNMSNLKELWIDFTTIPSIDLTSNIYLEWLFFGGLWEDDITGQLTWSPMTSINLNSNIFLNDISYYGGELEYLDLSNCVGIGYSDVSIVFPINMSCLNLANGTNGINTDGDVIGLNISDEFDEWGIACPSLCIQVDDVNISNSVWNSNIIHPNYTFSTDCGDCLSTSNLTELNPNQPKELIKIVNLLGQETPYQSNTVLIYQYSDGTSEKVFTIED